MIATGRSCWRVTVRGPDGLLWYPIVSAPDRESALALAAAAHEGEAIDAVLLHPDTHRTHL